MFCVSHSSENAYGDHLDHFQVLLGFAGKASCLYSNGFDFSQKKKGT